MVLHRSLPTRKPSDSRSNSSAPGVSSSGSSSSPLTSIPSYELLLTTTVDPNPLLPLLSLCSHPSPEVVHKAIYAGYRVFVHLAGEGRLFVAKSRGGEQDGSRERGSGEEDGRDEVARWIRDRLVEFLDVLLGLMRDSEPGLRKSAISIYLSLLPPLSLALSDHLTAVSRPSSPPSGNTSTQKPTANLSEKEIKEDEEGRRMVLISLPHVRRLLTGVLFGSSSARGAVSKGAEGGEREIVRENQWKLEAEENEDGSEVGEGPDAVESTRRISRADGRIPEEVTAELVKKLIDNDDLRWAFFKELSGMLERLDQDSSSSSMTTTTAKHLPDNILALLLPLQNLPKEVDDINAFWFPHVGIKPSKKRVKLSARTKGKKVKVKPATGKREDAQDWLAFYDTDSDGEEEDSEEEGDSSDVAGSTAKVGSKRKRITSRSRPRSSSSESQHALIHSPRSHQTLFTRTWLATLSLPLSPAQTRSILLVLHSTILPNMTRSKVVRLTDWLGSLVDAAGASGEGEGAGAGTAGALALLAMNGLYVLIRDYNLEYPQFYRRLYGLFGREVMHVKYRARFFRLSETFLSSPLLPAALVASFIKRLAQLSLTAPPAAIIMIIPFIYNLLKKHPACMMMLRGPDDAHDEEANAAAGKYVDPYDPAEADPSRSGALDSSLWELKTLQRHYLSHVATMAKLFGEVFTKPEFVMEDFLDHGYSSLFETEMARKIRSDPALNVDVVSDPFPAKRNPSTGGEADDDDVHRPEARDLVADLWTFGIAV